MKNNFFKKNKTLLISILVIVLLICAGLLLFKLIKDYKNAITKVEDVKMYEYFNDYKYDFKGKLSYNKTKLNDIETDFDIYEDGIIYVKNKVIFPKDMEVVFYKQNALSNKILKYSYIDKDILYYDKYSKPVEDYFLFDGKSIYLFPFDVTINTHNEQIKLVKNSYVKIIDDYIYIYNLENQKMITYDNNTKISASFDDIIIDLYNGTVINDGNTYIIQSDLSLISELKEEK